MSEPLMPKATAVWLVDNTSLTFEQIAGFCGLHRLEVQGIADGEVAIGIRGLDPIASGQLTREEIERCEADSKLTLALSERSAKVPQRTRRARYTPVSKRQDRPNAIAWLLKNYPALGDPEISKLLGTTKATINAVRDRTHWNTQNISPQDPLLLGICTEAELLEAVRKSEARLERAAQREARRAAAAERRAAAEAKNDAAIAESDQTEAAPSDPSDPAPAPHEAGHAPPEPTPPTPTAPESAVPESTAPEATPSEPVPQEPGHAPADPAPPPSAEENAPERDVKREFGQD